METAIYWFSSASYYLSVLIQLVCIIHIIREKKEYYWIFIVFFFSILGVLAYLFIEVLPEIKYRPYIRSLGASQKTSNRKLKFLQDAVEFSPTIEAKVNLADAHLSRDELTEAITLYEGCLKGIYKDDPHILFRLSEALYRNKDYSQSLKILHRLNSMEYKDYRNDRKFQMALCFSKMGNMEKSIRMLEKLAEVYPGEEVRYQLGMEYIKVKRLKEAKMALETVVKNRSLYKKAAVGNQRKWINLAKKKLKHISA